MTEQQLQDARNRIASLEGPCSAGWLVFADHLPQIVDAQMDSFPDGDHDDCIDAIEGAWRLSNTVRIGMVGGKRGGAAGSR